MKRHGPWVVYVLECRDGTYYTGSTNRLDARLKRHEAGKGAKYVRGRGPVRVVYTKAYRDDVRALRAERELKKLTRTQKQSLIRLHGTNGRHSS